MATAPIVPVVRGLWREHEPLALHTTWRVGGPADRYFEPADRADLLGFLRAVPPAEPLLWLGLGSNVLVRDGGFRGTVIALHGALNAIAAAGPHEIYAEAGAHCARLAKLAQTQAAILSPESFRPPCTAGLAPSALSCVLESLSCGVHPEIMFILHNEKKESSLFVNGTTK